MHKPRSVLISDKGRVSEKYRPESKGIGVDEEHSGGFRIRSQEVYTLTSYMFFFLKNFRSTV